MRPTSAIDRRQDPATLRVVPDDQDPDKQSLLIYYPSVVEQSEYVLPRVKIESGAKSAVDPNEEKTIVPYVGAELPQSNALSVTRVTTIHPERTFLDKVLILHRMTFYFEARGAQRGDGRMSRHYYDVHKLVGFAIGEKGCHDDALIEDCVSHARMFFYRNHTGLHQAKRGSFRLRPSEKMLDPLRKDYDAMSTMIFGEVPTFESILESVTRAEERLNAV